MNKEAAIRWAIHHMVVDYYHKLVNSVRKNINAPGLKFEDFHPVARERVEALMPTILSDKMSCQEEAGRILSWTCRDQQFMRKRKESEVEFAAMKNDESGEFEIVKKHRPSGRQRVITEVSTENEARKIRNVLIELMKKLPPIWNNFKGMSSSEQDQVKLCLFIGGILVVVLLCAIF